MLAGENPVSGGWSPDFLQKEGMNSVAGRRTLWKTVGGENIPGAGNFLGKSSHGAL